MTRNEFISRLRKNYPNVIGASFGLKSKDGVVTKEESINFDVKSKLPSSEVSRADMIPSKIEFDGVLYTTDVEEVNVELNNNTLFPPGNRAPISVTTIGTEYSAGGNQRFTVSGLSDQDKIYLDNSIKMGWGLNTLDRGLRVYPKWNSGKLGFGMATSVEHDEETGYTIITTSGYVPNVSEGEEVLVKFRGPYGGNDYAPGIGLSNDVNQQTGAIVGGASMSNHEAHAGNLGTLGFIAQDIRTGAVVGLTNAHIAVSGGIGRLILEDTNYTADSELPNSNLGTKIQWPWISSGSNETQIANATKGFVWRSNLMINTTTPTDSMRNTTDATVLYLNDGTFDANSFKQFKSEVISANPSFCTTEELDNLVVNGNDLFAVGSRTGAKGSDVDYVNGIKLKAIAVNQSINFPVGSDVNEMGYVSVHDVIKYAAFDSTTEEYSDGDSDLGPTIPHASSGGDSGSAVYANIDGEWKIAGLNFASTGNSAYFCRIDNIAELLDIEPWDGKTTQPTTGEVEEIIIPGQRSEAIIEHNGKKYYRDGYTTEPADTNK